MKTGFRLALGTIALLTVACGSNNESLFGPSGADEDAELSPGFAPFTPGVCAAPASLRSAAGARSCAASGHGGRAKVVQANVLGVVQATVVDSGDLPASGGSRHDALLKVGVAPILHAEAATASVVGQGSETSARAEVAKVEAKLLGIGISADVIDARAEARCTSSGVGRSGESRIAALRVGGLAIQVTGAPNQTLEINGILRVVINEQISWADGIRVNALHVTALGSLKVADLIVSSAEARIACSASCQSGGGSGCGGASCGGGSNGSDGSGGSNGGGSSGGGSNGGGSSGGGSSGGGSNGGGSSGGGSSGGGSNGGGSNGGGNGGNGGSNGGGDGGNGSGNDGSSGGNSGGGTGGSGSTGGGAGGSGSSGGSGGAGGGTGGSGSSGGSGGAGGGAGGSGSSGGTGGAGGGTGGSGSEGPGGASGSGSGDNGSGSGAGNGSGSGNGGAASDSDGSAGSRCDEENPCNTGLICVH